MNGPASIRENVTLGSQGSTYTGTFSIDPYDTSGNLLVHIVGQIKATLINGRHQNLRHSLNGVLLVTATSEAGSLYGHQPFPGLLFATQREEWPPSLARKGPGSDRGRMAVLPDKPSTLA